MTRVAVYARVSTKEQSTEAQVAQLTAYCQARGWTEVAVFGTTESLGSGITVPSSTGSGSGWPRASSRRSLSRRWTDWAALSA